MIEDIIVCGLASFAVTYMIKYTDGPFNIFQKFRFWIGLDIPVVLIHDEIVYEEDRDSNRLFAKVVKCFWCFTTWISAAFVIGYIFIGYNVLQSFPFLWFASIAVSGVIYELLNLFNEE